MDIAELLLFSVAVALFGIGYIFGRGNDVDELRLRQELEDRDFELDETRAQHQADLDLLTRTAEDLHYTMRERDERDAFIGHMRNDRAFQAWRGNDYDGDLEAAAGDAEIIDWLTSGLGLQEGKDFLVQPEFDGPKSPDFVRIHLGFAWVIETRDLSDPSALKSRLKNIVESETSYLTMPIKGRTNLGHMVVVTNPSSTANGILPVGYERHESSFFAAHDFNGFAAADFAMRTLAARLASVDTKVDPHHIELQANEVIRQGQAQIRAGQQLVMLGESIRQNLTGTIPFTLVDPVQYDDILFQPIDGNTTVRMKPLPMFNPMEANPTPLPIGDEEFSVTADEAFDREFNRSGIMPEADPIALTEGEDDSDDDDGGGDGDPHTALLDRLDEMEREAFNLSGPASRVTPSIRLVTNESDPDLEGPGRTDDPPTWV